MSISEIDVINAVDRMRTLLQKGENYDDSFRIISNSFNLTADEMDKLCEILPYER
jgi:hypothetical protein